MQACCDDQRTLAIIGTGMVGMSCAYAVLNQGLAGKLLLLDLNEQKAQGEAMDLNHGCRLRRGA